MSLLLDTHVWLRWLLDDQPLPGDERDALDRLASKRQLGISAISLWEAQMLHSKGRIRLAGAFDRWIRQASAADVVQVFPLDVEVIIAVQKLPRTFHGDPVDRLIVATARIHGLSLATHDAAIRKSRVIKIWSP